MVRRGEEAVEDGRQKQASGYTFPYGTCLKQVRLQFDVGSFDYSPGNGHDPWAIEAWQNADFKHPEKDPMKFPRATPGFCKGSSPYGHIFMNLGNGLCRTTDIPVHGKFGVVKIEDMLRKWNMTLLGWTEDLNNVRVWSPPKPPPPPDPVPLARKAVRADLLVALAEIERQQKLVPARRTFAQQRLEESRVNTIRAIQAVNKLPQ